MFDKPSIHLKLIGFSEIDQSRFEAIFSLAESNLHRPWIIVNDSTADFYLLSANLPSQFDQDKVLQALPRDRCIFYSTQDVRQNRYELRVDSNFIPRRNALVNLLNEVSSSLENGETTMPPPLAQSDQNIAPIPLAPPGPTTSSGEDVFDPGQGLLALLLSARHMPQILSFPESAGSTVIYLDGSNNYYCALGLEQLEAYFASSANISMHPISTAELLDSVAAEKLKPLPLSSLIWYTAFKSSQGRRLKGHLKGQIVQLKRWPDLGLPGCRQLVRLAAFMQSNSLDLETIAAQTQTSQEQVYDFYNACEIIGLIQQGESVEIHSKQINTEKRSLLTKIGKRLSQTSSQI